MTPVEFDNYVRFKTKETTSTLSSANLTALTNIYKDIFARKVAEINEDLLVIPATTDLVEDQREYPEPDDLIKIKQVEAKLDGTNWTKLKEFDINSMDRPTDESTIVNNFTNNEGEAYYDLFRGSIYLYSGSVSGVTGGLKLFYAAYPPDFTDLTGTDDMSEPVSSTSTALPDATHKAMADLVIIEIKEAGDKPMALSQREQLVEARISIIENEIRGKNLDRTVIGIMPDSTARMGNDGFNL